MTAAGYTISTSLARTGLTDRARPRALKRRTPLVLGAIRLAHRGSGDRQAWMWQWTRRCEALPPKLELHCRTRRVVRSVCLVSRANPRPLCYDKLVTALWVFSALSRPHEGVHACRGEYPPEVACGRSLG